MYLISGNSMLNTACSQVLTITRIGSVDLWVSLHITAFKAAQLFSPGKIGYLNPDAIAIDNLRSFPFLHDEELTKLKEELPNYLAIAINVTPEVEPLSWWKHQEDELPHLYAILCKCRMTFFAVVLLIWKSARLVSRTRLNPY